MPRVLCLGTRSRSKTRDVLPATERRTSIGGGAMGSLASGTRQQPQPPQSKSTIKSKINVGCWRFPLLAPFNNQMNDLLPPLATSISFPSFDHRIIKASVSVHLIALWQESIFHRYFSIDATRNSVLKQFILFGNESIWR